MAQRLRYPISDGALGGPRMLIAITGIRLPLHQPVTVILPFMDGCMLQM
jgi:hypothetical protein